MASGMDVLCNKNNKSTKTSLPKRREGTSQVVQGLRLLTLNGGNLSLIPGQGTRACMPQLKIPHAAAKTWGSQINTQIKKKKTQHILGGF